MPGKLYPKTKGDTCGVGATDALITLIAQINIFLAFITKTIRDI